MFIQEHREVGARSLQVTFVEFVSDVPSQGSELATLLDDGVEEAKAEEQFLPFPCL